jgi:hypothetical protein
MSKLRLLHEEIVSPVNLGPAKSEFDIHSTLGFKSIKSIFSLV